MIIVKYKYVKGIYYCVIFLAEKFVLSMIVRIFAPSVLAKPLNNAQIVRGVFVYTYLNMANLHVFKYESNSCLHMSVVTELRTESSEIHAHMVHACIIFLLPKELKKVQQDKSQELTDII